MDSGPLRPDQSPGEHGQPRQPPLTGDVIDSGSRMEIPEWERSAPFGDREGIGGWLFGPRSFRGGRVQVYGCSPGCIILSCVVSLVVSVLLTLLLNWII